MTNLGETVEDRIMFDVKFTLAVKANTLIIVIMITVTLIIIIILFLCINDSGNNIENSIIDNHSNNIKNNDYDTPPPLK